MTGSALMDFLIAVVGLCVIVYLIYIALDYIAPDARFLSIARYAVGGAAILVFLVAIKGVLFGGGGSGLAGSPLAVIEFAIGMIVVMVVLYLVYMVINRLAPPPLAVPIKYVVGAIALIAILVLAERAIVGGGPMFAGSNFQQLKR